MDVDASPPSHSLSSQGLPFQVVTSTHEEVVHYDLTNLPRAGRRDLCGAFRLGKTGNETDWLNKFSVGRDSLHAATRKKHRDGGVTKNTKRPGKRASTKRSTQHRELFFSTGADSMGSTTRPCLPTEESKDMRTDEERAAVLAWADSFVARNPYKPVVELEDEPSPRYWQHALLTRGSSDVRKPPPPYFIRHTRDALDITTTSIHVTAQLQLQQLQAQLAALTTAIAGGNTTSVAPSPAVVGAPAPAPAPAHRGPGPSDSATTTTDTDTTTATDGPSPTSLVASAPHGQLEYLKLGNGRSLCFSRQSVPDPPSISFAKDIPRLVRMWDDGSPEWSPLEAVLSIQGEPIALKHWPTVYRYGKSGQWAGTKKHWADWRHIATSWQELTEDGFWRKFCADGQPMSYTAICEALKEERMATDRCVA